MWLVEAGRANECCITANTFVIRQREKSAKKTRNLAEKSAKKTVKLRIIRFGVFLLQLCKCDINAMSKKAQTHHGHKGGGA
jgi:hypothetical protein